ncbi:MAG: class I SAM-dependent methyltransferase, partial [Planctomycetaceae bacterium]|nr:class I SAM-dependent methyltransferase [Planctomycetaceae bacterium]
HYDTSVSPAQTDSGIKESFLSSALHQQQLSCVWDIGCNLGRYSRIAAGSADLVVAMDSDPLAINTLYENLKREGVRKVVPLVFNVADPSPAIGWRCQERPPLWQRCHPDLILMLAVIHHLVLQENLLLADVLQWVADFQADLIIEFVDRTDPQIQQMLSNRSDTVADYSRENFLRELERRFRIIRQQNLPGGTRTLFHVTPLQRTNPRKLDSSAWTDASSRI